jgi:hypothetical protein
MSISESVVRLRLPLLTIVPGRLPIVEPSGSQVTMNGAMGAGSGSAVIMIILPVAEPIGCPAIITTVTGVPAIGPTKIV